MTTQTIGWGTTYSQVSILAEPIAADTGLAKSQIFFGVTLLYACAAVTSARAGRLADRFGGLILLITGSVVFSLALWLMSTAEGLVGYLIPWAIIGGFFHVGLVTSAYAALSQVLGRDAVGAVTTLTIATGLCSSIFWPFSEWLLATHSWRGVLQIYAALTLCFVLPVHVLLWWFLGKRRLDDAENAPSPAPSRVPAHKETRVQALMIAVASLGGLVTVGFGVVAIEMFTALGTPRAAAVWAAALIGPAYLVSRGAAFWLQRWTKPTQLTVITYAALPISIFPLFPFAFTGTALPGWVAAMVAFGFGLPGGMVGLVKSILPLYLFGSNGYGARLGLQARGTEAASAIAPSGFTVLLGLNATGLLGSVLAVCAAAHFCAVRLGHLVIGTEQSDAEAKNNGAPHQ
ncbi:MAG: MFS transporter [Pseudomonadota bacterium]